MTNFYMFVDPSVCIHRDVDSYALRRYQTIELSEYYWYIVMWGPNSSRTYNRGRAVSTSSSSSGRYLR